ncbi:hypothetical protein [Ruicaihuangia caeni]|uniref:hypothetical protein n=1 Tax=Ruicaihuangia caeni TaxID=3042517 RepID=UPI003390617F
MLSPARSPLLLRSASIASAHAMPLAELSAMSLDGELYPLAEAYASIAEPDTPALRALALHGILGNERIIADRWSAAWVWGALPRPPRVHTFCTRSEARVQHELRLDVAIREVVIDDGEIVAFGRARATSPLRTVLDLARSQEAYSESHYRGVLARLMDEAGLGLEACLAALDSRPLPFTRLARERLRRAQPAVTR